MVRWWLFVLTVFGLTMASLPGPARADGAPPISSSEIVLGNPSAPVTIIEYASLGCPYCAAFENETWPDVKKNWIETGKAKYVFRDFPTNGPAFHASLLAHCAPRDRFYAFIEQLYASQKTWMGDDEATTNMDALKVIATLGGVPAAQFDACQANTALQNQISAGVVAGQSACVESTPTFFINGTKVAGDLAYSDFNKALLAAAK
jgi:protein-disulfide isomerase